MLETAIAICTLLLPEQQNEKIFKTCIEYSTHCLIQNQRRSEPWQDIVNSCAVDAYEYLFNL